MLRCQSTKISAKLLAGVLPSLHARIDRRKLCERENGASKILRVPGHRLQSPQARRYACRSAAGNPYVLIEDRAYRCPPSPSSICSRAPSKGSGAASASRGNSSFKLRRDSRVCSQAGKVIQHPVGELLTGLAAKVDPRRYTPRGEQEERRRQPIPQPFAVTCRVRACEAAQSYRGRTRVRVDRTLSASPPASNATSWAPMNRPARTKASIGARTLQIVPTRSKGGSASLKKARKPLSICAQDVPPAICSTTARSKLLEASQAPARIAGMRSRPFSSRRDSRRSHQE